MLLLFLTFNILETCISVWISWRGGGQDAAIPSAPSLSSRQCRLLEISSLQKQQNFPSCSCCRDKLCCSEAAEEHVIISCFSFLLSLVYSSRMVHAHPSPIRDCSFMQVHTQPHAHMAAHKPVHFHPT